MKRIGIDIHSIGMRQTGNETYISNLARELSAGGHPWEFVHYHTRRPECWRDAGWDGTLRRLRPAHPLLRIPLAFPLALARDRIDLVHMQYVSPPYAPCPVMLTVHDISFEAHPDHFHPLQRKRLQWLVPRSIARAAHTLTVSEFTRSQICERYGVPPASISVTPNGVSASFRPLAPSESAAAAERFALHRPFVLGVGNLQPRKNLERLVQAYAQMAHAVGGDIDLVLVGKAAWGGHRVGAEVARLGLSDRVHRLGYVNQEELIALYNRALVFAYPSLYEGFGLPVLEAMACGTPVLTSNSSALPEVAGDAALLADPWDVEAIADGLRRLVVEPALRAALIDRGLARARSFGWERTARLTAATYARALAR